MDPSIVKFLEDDEDETMHSGADVEAFQAALNRDIGGDLSTSQPPDSDGAFSQGGNNSFSQSLPQWTAASQDDPSVSSNQQDQKNVPQQEQSSSEMETKQQGSHAEQPRNATSLEVYQAPLSQKQSQDEFRPGKIEQMSLQNPQTTGVPNSDKDSSSSHESVRIHNPNSESQYLKLQKMSNQQATVAEPGGTSINRSKQVPFGLLLPILQAQLDKDRAMQLQTLFVKLKKDEIPKDGFVRLMKGIVGDHMLRSALSKVQMQPRPAHGSLGQHPLRMPSTGAGATQFSAPPPSFAQLHQRPVNSSVADPSLITPTAVQVRNESTYPAMDNNSKRSQELERQVGSHGVQSCQLQSSASNMVGQEKERSSVQMHGLSKQQQQHLHFPSGYGSSGVNYNPYSGTNTGTSSSSLKPQPHDSQMRQVPQHHGLGSNQVGASQGITMMNVSKFERQNSTGDAQRMQGGPVSPAVNSAASQQNSVPGQQSTNKEHNNTGSLSTNSYVKKEPSDQSTIDQHSQQSSKLHGFPSVSASQTETGNAGMPPTASTNLLPTNSVSPMSHPDPHNPLNTNPLSTTAPGINAKTPPKKSSIGQKKPLEVLGSSPPPPSKKQKVTGASMEQSIEQLNDVTAVSGVDLREEEEQLFSGPKEDSRVSEASRRVVQEEEERLILQKVPLQRKLVEILAKSGLKGMNNDVEKYLSLCVEERMRGLISTLIRLSKQRVDSEKTRHRIVVTSDVRQQIMTMNSKAKEEWEKKQAEEEKHRKLNEGDSNAGVEGDKEKDEGRPKLTKAHKDEDDKMRTTAANVAARAAVGGDDMMSRWQLMAEQARQKREGGMDTSSSQSSKEGSRKSSSTSGRSSKDNQEAEKKGGTTSSAASGATRKNGKNNVNVPQNRVARSISVKDVIAALEREPQMSKSPLIYRLYEKIDSEATTE